MLNDFYFVYTLNYDANIRLFLLLYTIFLFFILTFLFIFRNDFAFANQIAYFHHVKIDVYLKNVNDWNKMPFFAPIFGRCN